MLNTPEYISELPLKVNRHLLCYLRETVSQLTQEELAKEIGVDLETVERWESGRKQPSQKHQRALEKFFNLQPNALTLELQHFIIEDFNAGYFGDEAARARLKWVNKNRRLAQALSLIPPDPKRRISRKIIETVFQHFR